MVFSGAVLIGGEIGLEVDEVSRLNSKIWRFLETFVSSGFVIGGKQVVKRDDAVKHDRSVKE